MEANELYWLCAIAAFFWWLFSRGQIKKSKLSTITTKETVTGKTKKEVRNKRQPQNRLTLEKPENFRISDEIKEVLDTLENSSQNVFLTGKAGTGKSTLLRYFRAITSKYPVVVAPTGVAAVNVQGQTIHSFFGWGISITPEKVRKVSYEKSKTYRNMRMLIIDEISMVRADLFECIDRFLRLNTGLPDKPFGGVQVVVIGDLYQLPPIVTNNEKKYFETVYESPFFFSSKGYSKGYFKKFELNIVFRQKDGAFVEALNAIREGIPTSEHITLLNNSVIQTEPQRFDDYVHLVTTNKMAKVINDKKMGELTNEPVTYQGAMSGTFSEKNAPTDLELLLKSGAQVMLLNNDREQRWVNGDVVIVLETKTNSIVVEFEDKTVQEVSSHTWETIRFIFDEEERKIVPQKVGAFSQIPVKPAWAMTIHKAQGKTFEKVFIDLGSGAFAQGQTYVALSRCKSLNGLRIATPLTLDDVFVNEQVRQFMSFAHKQSTSPPPINHESKSDTNFKKNKETVAVLSKQESKKPKISEKEFTLRAIRNLRDKKYKGIHVVYSGFNKAFREHFESDPIKAVKHLESIGVVVTKPVKGGVMLYDAKEYGSSKLKPQSKNVTLKKILGED